MTFLPLVILDVFIEIYHQIGFRLCEIELVKRSSYIQIDRPKLKYLKLHDKINCMFCGYANGLIAYVGEIAARTESYWCSIKHAGHEGFDEPEHHKDYVQYGDENTFKKTFENEETTED